MRRVAVAVALALPITPSIEPPALPGDHEVARVLLQAEGHKSLPAPLLELAAVPDASVRARTALALGRIGLPAGAGTLLALAGDSDAGVRAAAAFALGRLELDLATDPAAVSGERIREALEGLLADPGPAVAAAALWSLGFVEGSMPALAGWLRAADPDTTDERSLELALGSWWRIGGEAGVPERFLGWESERIRIAAAHALRRLDVPAGLPLLARLLDDPAAEVRLMALRGLDDAPVRIVEARAPTLLRDRDWRVQSATAAWLAGRWRQEGAELPSGDLLADVLRRSLDRNLHVRRSALEALGVLVQERPVAADRLLQALEEDEPALRATALEALAAGGESIRRQAWRRLLGGEPRSGDTEWMAALAREPHLVEPVLQLQAGVERGIAGFLETAAREGAEAVAGPALRLLARQEPSRAVAVAGDFLAAEDPQRVSLAATTLIELSEQGHAPLRQEQVERMWRLYYDGRDTGLEPARGSLLTALLRAAPELMARRATLLLQEPDRVLRLRAWRALAGRPELEESLANMEWPFHGHGPAERVDWGRLAERAVALQGRPVRVRLQSERGEALLELRADWAPRTVVQLVELLREGAFESTRFYRVIPGFVAQGGPPPALQVAAVPGEDSLVPYRAGTVGLALAGRDTGSAQIYVTHASQPHLEGLYPVLGTVIEGQRAVDRIQPGDLVSLTLEGELGAARHR